MRLLIPRGNDLVPTGALARWLKRQPVPHPALHGVRWNTAYFFLLPIRLSLPASRLPMFLLWR
jgi:hypothetical protein